MSRFSEKLKIPGDWADPKSSHDLPVDPKKLSEIQTWLNNNRSKSGILLISGPTGSAKTASLRIIAKDLEFEITEWITPLDRTFTNHADAGPDVFQNQTTLFDDFLYSSSRYRSLFSRARSQLVLIEDYPNVFLRDPSLFHDVLSRYRVSGRSPAVFICSEVADRSLKMLSDLFPSSVQLKLGICHISFNPVSRTRMISAVRRMGLLLQKVQPSFGSISADTCNDITTEANGDVRYATLALQMGLSKSISDLSLFDNPMKRQTVKLKDSESEAVKVCGKDDKVGLLHAVGRVLYPKLAGEASTPKSNVLGKRKRKETFPGKKPTEGSAFTHDPSSIADSYSSSASMFVLFVQENYLNMFSSIDSVAKASATLSDSDVMMTAEGAEISHDMSFYITLNGVMSANKVPNRSWNPVRRPRSLDTGEQLKGLFGMLPPSILLFCVNTTTLMKDFATYLPKLPSSNLTRDQRSYLESLCSMKPFSSKNPLPLSGAESQQSQSTIKIDGRGPDSEELHISDPSDSEEEKDTRIEKGGNNISDDWNEDEDAILAAVEAAEQGVDYEAMLMDTCDDEILLASQH